MFELDNENRIRRIRAKLLGTQPWYGALAMRLKIEFDASVQTMDTNGTVLRINPQWAISSPEDEVLFTLAHEVLHCALLHPYRCYSRDIERWNRATDFVVNRDLEKAGFTLPDGILIDPQYEGMGADTVYARLGKDENEDEGKEPQPKPEPSTGTISPAPAEAEGDGDDKGEGGFTRIPAGSMTAHDWQVATKQATMVTNKAGNTPSDAAMSAKLAYASTEDWRAALREFVAHTQPSDYSWAKPNRRHIHSGLYLPGVIKENTGRIGVGWDSSGSMFSKRIQDVIASEMTSIMQETKPDSAEVVYCDCAVRKVETFTPDDEFKFDVAGGGGTAFQPVFDHFNASEQPPLGVIYFTDLCGDNDTVKEPEYPVLWITSVASIMEPPFGRVIRIDAEME